jgi:hypothetical protein
MRVMANDNLKFNYRSAQALIENPNTHLLSEDVQWLLTRHDTLSYGNFIQTEYEGMYFTQVENAWLDYVAYNIQVFQEQQLGGDETVYKVAIAWHALVQAALAKRPFNLFHRRNLYLREADVDRRFGNKTTWDTPFSALFMRFIDEANRAVVDNGHNNQALNRDVADLSDIQADLIYLDPPYFAERRERARSNYRLLYHFVEGLVDFPRWQRSFDGTHHLKALTEGKDSMHAIFSNKPAQIGDLFLAWMNRVIHQWPDSAIAVSYKHPGTPSIRSLRNLLIASGRRVKIRALPYSYALSKKNGKPKENIEVLLIGH